MQKGSAGISWCIKLFEYSFLNYSCGMQVTKMTHVSEDRMDVERELPEII